METKAAKPSPKKDSLRLTLICAVFVCACTFVFLTYFKKTARSTHEISLSSEPLKPASATSAHAKKLQENKRIRLEAMEAERRLQERLVARRSERPVTTLKPDEYVDGRRNQIEESIREIGVQRGLAVGLQEDLERLGSDDH